VAAYGALTAVVAIGVTMGILLAQTIGDRVGRESPSPSVVLPSESPSPPPGASDEPIRTGGPPLELVPLPDVSVDAITVAAAEGAVWAADGANRLVDIDPSSGGVLRSVDLPRLAADLLVTVNSVWVASLDGDLVRVDRSTLAVTEIPGTSGGALAIDDVGRILVGGENRVVRVDPASDATDLAVPVPGRPAQLGVAGFDGAIWVATQTAIVRLDEGDGAVTGQIAGDATALAIADGRLWASRGIELLRIDTAALAVDEILAGIPAGSPMGAAEGFLWIAGPPGGGAATVVGVDPAGPSIAYQSIVEGGAVDVAATGSIVWVAQDEGTSLSRFGRP
jgi:hypothetical protein